MSSPAGVSTSPAAPSTTATTLPPLTSTPSAHPLLAQAVDTLRQHLPRNLLPTNPWSHAPAWILAAVQYIMELRQQVRTQDEQIRTHEAAATMSKVQVDRLMDQIEQQNQRIHNLVAEIERHREHQQTTMGGFASQIGGQLGTIITLRNQLRELGVEPVTNE